ncbi:MAG: ATP-cobalamin adenosyltransferase [Microgenomates group bacterium GW2011_GWC1_41_20]|uniref:Corrinoid adenosyltransferase n=6 Tax=Candidatus Woeseibacteriota TaxID=1752722 RepID=A0A0G0RTU8_9BACT|nr:MAG: Cob(I)alamin adenosyltransferase [Candidatus Woesebacteria bacterium GW2011_GWB1_40_12]KKR55963.1 MAG: Cob(I)alamin adenosyltransferase [Candidatus Woesebacteria bacterium GW2011_GWF1_40_24]KKS00173.1 MAG: ATP-cobalamin adenosyltransferase [Microgenomates group bacterium GW2011_GWC1_41_20]KKS05475.1 MAG: Cob(I)alamin adenosyltransferase [Candidatus Woesebacteria bacterium GW2011_GWE1_41_24]KKS18692.1 MAG: Cob(I)alamin adenosyltransferase [Candidatus Woesebacteria bacterium GW2011_GWA1_4
MAIYTKKGDKGETGLFSSDKSKKRRISKASLKVEAIGSVDEANTFLGLSASFMRNKEINLKIIEIQRHLFEVGARLAGARIDLDENLPKEMEKEIDEMDKELPKLTHFILPGGSNGGSLLFMARTFIRRAERRVVSLSKKEKVNANLIIYLNRLSDYVYTLARYSNFKEGIKEKAWRG